jgi:hypothetical protein
VPALTSSILEPLWVQVSAQLPARQDTHPLGCHRPASPTGSSLTSSFQVLVAELFQPTGAPYGATVDTGPGDGSSSE